MQNLRAHLAKNRVRPATCATCGHPYYFLMVGPGPLKWGDYLEEEGIVKYVASPGGPQSAAFPREHLVQDKNGLYRINCFAHSTWDAIALGGIGVSNRNN